MKRRQGCNDSHLRCFVRPADAGVTDCAEMLPGPPSLGRNPTTRFKDRLTPVPLTALKSISVAVSPGLKDSVRLTPAWETFWKRL